MDMSQLRHAQVLAAENLVMADLQEKGLAPSPEPAVRLNKDQTVAVGDYYFEWMKDCPLGVKVQLLTPHGVAIYGVVVEKTRGDYRGWAPVPKKREGM